MVYNTFNLDDEINFIVEAGSHCGTEAKLLLEKYPEAEIYTYEADPDKWNRIENNLGNSPIIFRKVGLGERFDEKMFYKFVGYENDGADSFFPRYNGDMKAKKKVSITTLEFEMAKYNIPQIDLLAMDTQGYEYFILKGLGDRIKDVKNIILELPDVRMDTKDFKIPDGQDSVYNGAKCSKEIIEFLEKNGFKEVCRKRENLLESNVHFKKIN